MVWSWRDGPAGDVPWQEVFAAEPPPVPPGDPVVVAVAFDEMLRLPDFLRHHRDIGVRHFVIVDNGSTDDTAAFLDAQRDVTRLWSDRPFRSHKKLFRPWIADTHLVGRWVLMPDIDEHFVYPGWPQVPLTDKIAEWDRQRADAVFAPMVDMYADRPIREIGVGPETRLREVCDRFDATSYWLEPIPARSRRNARIPPYMVYGGTRDRLFARKRGLPDALDAALRRGPLGLGKTAPGNALARALVRANRRDGTSQMSKVPLVKWRRGTTFPGSNHRVRADLRLADEWGALLHFKYLPDFKVRSEAAAARGQHSHGSEEYRRYLREIDAIMNRSFCYKGTRRLRDWRDLAAAGLIRAATPGEASG